MPAADGRSSSAFVSSALVAPGGLGMAELIQGNSAVRQLDETHPVAVGAPVIEPLGRLTEDHVLQPRALLLALEVARRLELDADRHYGLVLGMSSLYAEPPYLEHMLPNRDRRDRMEAIAPFAGEFPLEALAAALGIDGPRVRVDTACSSGSDALIVAHRWLETQTVSDVIVVAAASMLNPVGLALFHNLRALSDDPDLGASRPFDLQRRGFVMGEGAAGVWLSCEPPKEPLGYLCGCGASMNAEKFTDMPNDLAAMETACRDAMGELCAGGSIGNLAYISAHGTGTPVNDPCETRLYKSLFGERAYDLPISSLKSMTGHCLGASSLIEAVVTLEALRRQTAPPTLNLEYPDPECDLDFIPEGPRRISGNFALSSAFAFGGHNSSVLLALEAPC